MSPFLQNILLGISLAAPIGPVSVEIIRRGLAKGFLYAVPVCLGAAFGDLIYLLLAYYGLAPLMSGAGLRLSIMGLGAAILLFMGFSSIFNGFKSADWNQSKRPEKTKNGFILGAMLAMVNPMTVVWWVGIFGTVIGSNPSQTVGISALLNYSVIILGILSWTLSMSAALHFSKKIIQAQHMKWITVIAGICLLFFGMEFGMQVVAEVMESSTTLPFVNTTSP